MQETGTIDLWQNFLEDLGQGFDTLGFGDPRDLGITHELSVMLSQALLAHGDSVILELLLLDGWGIARQFVGIASHAGNDELVHQIPMLWSPSMPLKHLRWAQALDMDDSR